MTHFKNYLFTTLAGLALLSLGNLTSVAAEENDQSKNLEFESLETYDLEREEETAMQLDEGIQASFPSDFEVIWETRIVRPSRHAGSSPELVSDDQHFYFLSLNRCLSKFNQADGKLVWGTCLSEEWEEFSAEFGGFILNQQSIYIASSSGYLAKLNSETGRPVWQRSINLSLRGNPVVYNDLIVVRTADNRTLAFFAETGRLAWIQRAVQRRFGILDNLSPQVFGDTLLVTHASGFMQRLLGKTGQILWQTDLFEETPFGFALREQLRDIKVKPIIEDGIAYVSAYSDQTAALNLNDGKILWRTAISSVTPPILSGNSLFIVDTFNNLVAVHKENGKLFWSSSIDQAIKQAALGNNDQLQISREFYDDYIKMRGNPFWLKMLQLEDQLVLISDTGIYLIYQLQTGELTGYGKMNTNLLSGPLLIDGVLYLVDYDDHLVALGKKSE